MLQIDSKPSELKGKVILLATGNVHKFIETRRILAEFGIASGMLRVGKVEIQSDSLEDIAKASAIDAFDVCHLPIIVEDAGLFVAALNGFPGPYAAYVYRTISNPGMLKLMEGVLDREAKFQSVIAYYDGKSDVVCFEGEALGRIAYDELWGTLKTGFGFDPIFQPVGSKKTFAEMTFAEKNSCSHRGQAVRQFAKWFKAK